MRKRLLSTTAVAAATLAAAFAIGGPRPAAAASWTSTATQATSLANAAALGNVPSTQTLHIAVALQLRNRAALDSYIAAINNPSSSQYGNALSPAAFAAQYGPTGAAVQQVTSYLSGAGLTNIRVAPNNLFVTADGTAAQIEAAFNTHLGLFSQNGSTVYANTTAAQVPSTLSGTVVSVLGLNDASVMKPPKHKASGSTGSPTGVSAPQYLTAYAPQGFQKAYDVAKTPTGAHTSIAIITEGDMTGVISDLRTEEKANALPQVPVTVVQTGLASSDTSGADEWDMDTQFSTGMAQTVSHLYLYDSTSLTDSDLALAINSFAAQDVAKAGSASLGECEVFPYVDGAMLADDEVFAEAAAQGQTFFASAGDTGGFCAVAPTNGAPVGAPFVNYPASSPYVVAVGGTTLLTNSDGTYNNELAWLAGGGGTSAFETSPFWQAGVVPAANGTVGKALPDVSMDADPNSGANVYINGTPTAVGGTSLSSPLSLGVWARVESAHANALGFAAPHLYKLYGTAAYHDIILGDTGPYPATPGYDYATGMGTFDVAQTNALIK